jgi:hypothetical protein
LNFEDWLILNTVNIQGFVRNLEVALALYDLCLNGGNSQNGELGGIYSEFRILVAKQFSLNIYHIRRAIDCLGDVKVIKDKTYKQFALPILEKASNIMTDSFPDIIMLRQAIAHEGQLMNSLPKARTQHQRKDATFPGGSSGAGGIFMVGTQGRFVTLNRGGKLYTIEVSGKAVEDIREITALITLAVSTYRTAAQKE